MRKVITLIASSCGFWDLSDWRQSAYNLRQIEQIRRGVIECACIGHEEKAFSLFEEHTEWVSQGKAELPVELGLRICVLEDQFGFILLHQVMDKKGDDQVALSLRVLCFGPLADDDFRKGSFLVMIPCSAEKYQLEV